MTTEFDVRLLGSVPSPVDDRDYPVQPLLDEAVPVPAKFRLKLLGPVLDQGNTGRCVAFSGTGIRQQEERAGGDWPKGWPPLDAQWLYDEARKIDGISDQFAGTTIRAALHVLAKKGQPLVGKPATTPQFRIAEYRAVPFRAIDIKRALMAVGPVWIGTRWYANWFHPIKGIMPSPIGPSIGGHARFIFGWDDTVAGGSFLVRNSWGRDWPGSINGNSYDPYAALVRNLHDAWTTLDMKGAHS